MIDSISAIVPAAERRQPRQGKPQTRPQTSSSQSSEDMVQLSPEALAAAHDDDADHES
jgi:hypothetical protein